MVGHSEGTIISCRAEGNVTAKAEMNLSSMSAHSYAGGIVGRLYRGTVSDCERYGDVFGTGVGGFKVQAISYSHSGASQSYAGGVAGQSYGKIKNCTAGTNTVYAESDGLSTTDSYAGAESGSTGIGSSSANNFCSAYSVKIKVNGVTTQL